MRTANTIRVDEAVAVVTNRIDPSALQLLGSVCRVVTNDSGQPWTKGELIARTSSATALLAFMTDSVDDEVLANCPHLKIVSCALKGYDNFDVEAFSRRGVWLTVVPDLLSAPTAELTLGLMIAAARKITEGDSFVRSGGFHGWRAGRAGTVIAGSTVGIIGMGSLGRAIARCLSGFGARLIYCDPRPAPTATERELGIARVDLAELLPISEFVLLAAPLSPRTTHLMDRQALGRMKQGAILINTARGSLVDESAVAAALEEGRLGAYAADVFELEDQMRPDRPKAIPSGLITSRSTVFTPHVGSAVPSIRREIERYAANSIVQFFQGMRPPPGAINHL